MIANRAPETVSRNRINPAADDSASAGRSYPLAVAPASIGRRWWRPLVAVLALVAAYLVLNVALSLAAVAFDGATGLSGGLTISPALYLAMNLSLAALIPISLVLHKWLHGHARGLYSVVGHIRWRLVGVALLITVPVWAVQGGTSLVAGQLRLPSTAEFALLVIVLLTTPLQAAGEEFAFRGLLNRSFASWSGRLSRIGIIIGMVLSSVVFSLAHLAFQPVMLLYFMTFGAALAVIAWRTGGLEVPIVIHAVHNVTQFATGLFLTGKGIDALATRGEMEPGMEMVVMIVFMVVVAAVTWVITAIRPVRRTVPFAEQCRTVPFADGERTVPSVKESRTVPFDR